MDRCEEVLETWFGPPGGPIPPDRFALWFRSNPAIDRMLRERFGSDVESALAGGLSSWEMGGRSRLALILLLDQLPRNIFRGTPRTFAGDARALDVARGGTEKGMDLGLSAAGRMFFYMPFLHAEDRQAQLRAVQLFRNLMDGSSDPGVRMGYASALRHREIVERFGRFPHRNRILGRAGTDAEERFLLTPGSSF